MIPERYWTIVGAVEPKVFRPTKGKLLPTLISYIEGGAVQAWWAKTEDSDVDAEILLGRLCPAYRCYPGSETASTVSIIHHAPELIYKPSTILNAYPHQGKWMKRWMGERRDAAMTLGQVMTMTNLALDWEDAKAVLRIEESERRTNDNERRNELGMGHASFSQQAGRRGGGEALPF